MQRAEQEHMHGLVSDQSLATWPACLESIELEESFEAGH